METAKTRRMPSRAAICRLWGRRDSRHCWRCGTYSSSIHRAHIVDRSADSENPASLDIVENLWLLCGSCHSSQPSFEINEYNCGLAWMNLDSKNYHDYFKIKMRDTSSWVYKKFHESNEDFLSLVDIDEVLENSIRIRSEIVQEAWDHGITTQASYDY